MTDIIIKSFGFKYGIPNANNYIDVSFLKNPARETQFSLNAKPTEEMEAFLLNQPNIEEFLGILENLSLFLISTKDCPVLAFGCSAGRHRSWIIAEIIGKRLINKGFNVSIIHTTPDK